MTQGMTHGAINSVMLLTPFLVMTPNYQPYLNQASCPIFSSI